jgi:hypothetical protein
MELILNTPKQHMIATLLWEAPDDLTVQAVLRIYGAEARAIQDLMIVTAQDHVISLAEAQSVLNSFRK